MFNNPFSFNGRIRRAEFGLSYILVFVLFFLVGILAAMLSGGNEDTIDIISIVLIIPIYWFLFAQGAKRCHDIGHSGWWQLIPLYYLWMLFEDGDIYENEYGMSPKYKIR